MGSGGGSGRFACRAFVHVVDPDVYRGSDGHGEADATIRVCGGVLEPGSVDHVAFDSNCIQAHAKFTNKQSFADRFGAGRAGYNWSRAGWWSGACSTKKSTRILNNFICQTVQIS
jgi:hypothetical protein